MTALIKEKDNRAVCIEFSTAYAAAMPIEPMLTMPGTPSTINEAKGERIMVWLIGGTVPYYVKCKSEKEASTLVAKFFQSGNLDLRSRDVRRMKC